MKQVDLGTTDHPDKQCRDREIMVYQNLLSGKEALLPVARCLGWEPRSTGDGYDLYLEHLDGSTLNERPMEDWLVTARQLGQFHAVFAARDRELAAARYLQNFDRGYFLGWAARARDVLGKTHPSIFARLDPLWEVYPRLLTIIDSCPTTLVHNDLAPQNILVVSQNQAVRVCFVDWELAGRGCGLLDLVHLAYGFDEDRTRQLTEVYWQGWIEGGGCPGDLPSISQSMAVCALHKTIYRLARSRARAVQPEQVVQWIRDAEALIPLAEGDRRRPARSQTI